MSRAIYIRWTVEGKLGPREWRSDKDEEEEEEQIYFIAVPD